MKITAPETSPPESDLEADSVHSRQPGICMHTPRLYRRGDYTMTPTCTCESSPTRCHWSGWLDGDSIRMKTHSGRSRRLGGRHGYEFELMHSEYTCDGKAQDEMTLWSCSSLLIAGTAVSNIEWRTAEVLVASW